MWSNHAECSVAAGFHDPSQVGSQSNGTGFIPSGQHDKDRLLLKHFTLTHKSVEQGPRLDESKYETDNSLFG